MSEVYRINNILNLIINLVYLMDTINLLSLVSKNQILDKNCHIKIKFGAVELSNYVLTVTPDLSSKFIPNSKSRYNILILECI